MTRLPIALTMGEPAGIGGEIALKAWSRRAEGVPAFFLIDSPARIAALARSLGLDLPVCTIERPAQALTTFERALPILPIDVGAVTSGQPAVQTAKAVIGAIERAVALVRAGYAAAVVTNPIQKKPLYDAGFAHPGHTEFLVVLSGADVTPVMMLAVPELRVVPLSIHVPLATAISSIRGTNIVAIAEIVLAALQNDFGLKTPRLAVAGLNPHAGESGSLGTEENTIIGPAIDVLRARGHMILGPLVPDAMFADGQRQRYDAALCMYHDQALIPLKTLDFERGVNITLGLPFVRTSPDHGTALDIAGKGVASPVSLMEALKLARAMADRRAGSKPS